MDPLDAMMYHNCQILHPLNGSPHKYFEASNEIWQGDPLSPLLFIIVTIILNRMLALGKTNNLFNGIQFLNGGPNVMNIQFADVTLIFLEPLELYCHKPSKNT